MNEPRHQKTDGNGKNDLLQKSLLHGTHYK